MEALLILEDFEEGRDFEEKDSLLATPVGDVGAEPDSVRL